MARHVSALALATCAALVFPEVATAQRSPGVFRIGLDGTLFSVENETQALRLERPGYGAASETESEISHTRFGLLSPRLGLQVGVLVGNLVLIGTRLGISSDSAEADPGLEQSDFRWTVAPTVQVLFPTAGPLRPSLGGYVGAAGREMEVLDSDGTQLSAQSGTAVVYGGSLGLHVFASDHVSVAASIGVGGSTGTFDVGMEVGAGEADVSTFEVTGVVGINVWLGGTSETPQASRSSIPSEIPEPTRPPRAPGEAYTRIPGSEVVVDLWTDAAGDPGAVSMRVARVGELPALGGCDRIELVGTAEVSVDHRADPHRSFVEEELYGRTDLATLRHFAAAPTPQIGVCRLQLDLSRDDLLLLRTFLDEAEAQQPAPVAEPPQDPSPSTYNPDR